MEKSFEISCFLLRKNTYSAICIYLPALQSKYVVCMLPSEFEPELLSNLIEKYEPEWIAFADSYTWAAGLRQAKAVQINDYRLLHLERKAEKIQYLQSLLYFVRHSE
ncbi:hypothetical protein [Saccharibacillus deserti]|uniref:hypothetical protein n=1 Tax=Saccharibacillus deserti TaxID=1634444 RepID=UPI001554A76F|nr:hypothetical protein [Saccharibacillus deserti]